MLDVNLGDMLLHILGVFPWDRFTAEHPAGTDALGSVCEPKQGFHDQIILSSIEGTERPSRTSPACSTVKLSAKDRRSLK
jgi:hypothetical protein